MLSRIVQKGHDMYKCYYTGPTISFTHKNDSEKHLFCKLRVKITLTKQDKNRTALCNPRITFKHITNHPSVSFKAFQMLEKCQNDI